MRASGDPYLQHCVETAVSLALIGANSTVVAAGLLHDTLDDTFMSYDYVLRNFGAGVADLIVGVRKNFHLDSLCELFRQKRNSKEVKHLPFIFPVSCFCCLSVPGKWLGGIIT